MPKFINTFRKGQRFAIEGKVYELNQDTSVCVEIRKCYIDGKEVDLRDYATYVEPFDEQSWRDKMAKRGMYFHGALGMIFF